MSVKYSVDGLLVVSIDEVFHSEALLFRPVGPSVFSAMVAVGSPNQNYQLWMRTGQAVWTPVQLTTEFILFSNWSQFEISVEDVKRSILFSDH